MTLDGVMEAPGNDEHPDGKNAWALQHATDDMQRYKIEEIFAVDALLLGRVTYQILDEDVGGIGVHIAARVLGEASDDQVVVTRTVRELATGTDLIYDPLGTVHIRGVPGDWELFAASTP